MTRTASRVSWLPPEIRQVLGALLIAQEEPEEHQAECDGPDGGKAEEVGTPREVGHSYSLPSARAMAALRSSNPL